MEKLTITPVTAYLAPTYPTRGQLGADPEVLRRVPRRWRGQAVVLAVLAGAGVVTLAAGTAQAVEKAKIVARLAPLFPLGIERPRLAGDVAVPTLLTEEEARVIVLEEAKKAGISFAPDALAVEKVRIGKDGNRYANEFQQIDLTLDGTDAKRKIHYEIVTEADLAQWRGTKEKTFCLNTLDAATTLREGLSQKLPEGTTVLFHDDGSRETLRKQVQEFIAWLKAEGVI